MSIENYVAIDREELARLRADSAELARVREPVKACVHEFSDNGEFEIHCHLCDLHIDATPPRELMDEASQMAFEAGGDNDGGYILAGDEFDQIIAHVVSQTIVEREVAFRAKAAPECFALVPVEPTEAQWGGLARAIVFWMRSYPSNKQTPATLVDFLLNYVDEIPAWMGDESELRAKDHVISKGTIAVLIYKAMLAAAPKGDSHE